MFDCTGVAASDLAGDVSRLLKATMKVMQAHYPERQRKLFVVNAPSWFTSCWSLISPWIDPATKTKISILGTDFHAELFKVIAPENVPLEFGGKDTTALGESPEEYALRACADRTNGGPGMSFKLSLEAQEKGAGDSSLCVSESPLVAGHLQDAADGQADRQGAGCAMSGAAAAVEEGTGTSGP